MCLHAGVRTAGENGDLSGTVLGKPAEEGESPVHEKVKGTGGIRSSAGHEEPCVKAGGPPPKAKYYSVTDRG